MSPKKCSKRARFAYARRLSSIGWARMLDLDGDHLGRLKRAMVIADAAVAEMLGADLATLASPEKPLTAREILVSNSEFAQAIAK